MRAKTIKESYNFQRGIEPKDAMGTSANFNSVFENLFWNMDKFMPDDPKEQETFYDIIGDTELVIEQKVAKLSEFIHYILVNEEYFWGEMPPGAEMEDFALWIIKHHID